MIPQSTRLYAVETKGEHAALHLVIAWQYTPPIPLSVMLATTKPGPRPSEAQPLGDRGAVVTYYDNAAGAHAAYRAVSGHEGPGGA